MENRFKNFLLYFGKFWPLVTHIYCTFEHVEYTSQPISSIPFSQIAKFNFTNLGSIFESIPER